MAILVEVGRAAVATAIMNQTIHCAWGAGDPSWDASRPVEPASATGLVKEIGRRVVTQKSYVQLDPQGSIVVPGNRFEFTTTPTKYLYLRFAFEFDDAAVDPAAPGQPPVIRELGVFINTVPLEHQPSGNATYNPNFPNYLMAAQGSVAAEYSAPGQLLVLEYIDKLTRANTIRQQFEFVIQF